MKQIILATALVFGATAGAAQHAQHGHASNGSNGPLQTGQAQFAAIAEIVALLRADQNTDWARVDIKALRDHLLDMDLVTTQAAVNRTVTARAVTFRVSADGQAGDAIRRMVMAHSVMLQRASGWAVEASADANGASMTVRVASQEALDQVLGLGFFGVMTIGAHHQRHHLMIARGHSPH